MTNEELWNQIVQLEPAPDIVKIYDEENEELCFSRTSPGAPSLKAEGKFAVFFNRLLEGRSEIHEIDSEDLSVVAHDLLWLLEKRFFRSGENLELILKTHIKEDNTEILESGVSLKKLDSESALQTLLQIHEKDNLENLNDQPLIKFNLTCACGVPCGP